jgi:FKBP-type peptidyl-prolyl cis-trans isomerase
VVLTTNSMKSLSIKEWVGVTIAIVVVFFFLGRNLFLSNNVSNTMSEKVAVNGAIVSVHYTGKLQNGTVFDSSLTRGQPIQFVLGSGQVIKGWDEGILGMKVGDKKTLTIPPEKAYGVEGYPPVIPPNATLIFDVELVDVISQ